MTHPPELVEAVAKAIYNDYFACPWKEASETAQAYMCQAAIAAITAYEDFKTNGDRK